jgi:hypothetical protein
MPVLLQGAFSAQGYFAFEAHENGSKVLTLLFQARDAQVVVQLVHVRVFHW